MLTKRFKFTLLLVFFWYGQANSNDFFIAKKFNWDFVCVTNSSSALSWITDNIEDDISQDSKYAPETSTSTFNTIVENPWLYKNSLESEISEVILDKRWEGMKVYQTEFVEGNGQELKFSIVLTALKADFVIPFSIRTEKQAHIFLCDGDYVPISNCYWFLLHAWSGENEKSAIRKCPGAISLVNGVYPNGTCEKLLTSISHWKKPKYFFKDKWSHFQLSKTKNFLRLEKYKNENKFLEYQDMENPIKVTHMIIHSKGVSGLWKIHKTNFIYSNQTLNEVLLGRFTQFNQASLCLSMFVAMCNSCSMKLILKEGYTVLHYQIYYFKNSGWSEIKFVNEAVTPRSGFQMNLFVSANSNDPQQFWAIDKIRFCQKQEFPYITTNSPAECQLITGDDVISIKKREKISENTCPENTIGDFCVPCEWLYINCDQIQICDKDRCVCSAGFKPQRNNNCRYACDESFYGHGCQKQCGNCKYRRRCHHVNGSCNSECESMYTGPRCDILSSLLFLTPPTVADASYLEATVIRTNFSIHNGVDEVPSYYAVEYAEAGKGTNPKWIRVDQYQLSLRRPIIIENLKADTEYFVRSVIISNVGKIYNDSHVKFAKFKTKCENLSQDIIDINPKDTSAVVIIQMSEKLCRMEHYSAYVKLLNVRNSRKLEPPFRNNSVLYFEKLNPFTYYTITFKGTGGELKKNFHTTEGVPELVENINITHQSPTTIDLTWPEPILSGKLKHYIVEYQRMSSIACGNQTTTDSKKPRLETKDALATLNHIIPYSKYLLWVTAANTEFEGPANQKLIETLASYNVEPEEVPEFDKIVPTTPINANVYFNINCDNVRGPLSVQTSIICTNEWCTEKKNLSQNIKNNSFISIFDLTPFSAYEFEFRFCHGDNCTNELKKGKFKTGPAAPNSVRELEVYSKNENSISVRWKPPFPPNGVLKDYSIAYKQDSYWSRNESKNINITACDLWPEFHCVQLFALKENVEYAITVYPRNEKPSHFGQASTIKTTTKTEPSKPPYDLNVTWTSQNDLELEWKHPNQTNGDVQHFTINIALNKANGAVVLTERLPIMNNIYNLTYYYTVASDKLEPTTKYTISVSAFNGLFGLSATKFETSPPDIPKLDNDLQATSSNNVTATVTISPKQIRGKTDNYRLILLISNEKNNLDQYPELNNFYFKNLNVIFNCSIKPQSFMITIGNKKPQPNCSKTENLPLEPATSYNITTVLMNSFANSSRFNVYSIMYITNGMPEMKSTSSLFGLLALLLVIPVAVILYMKKDKLLSIKNNSFETQNTSTEILELKENQTTIPSLPQNIQAQKKHVTIPTKTSSDSKVYSKAIKITEFEEYVKESIKNGELERQHALFPRGQTKPWTCGSLKENKSKNRYNNLIAYDHTRVILQKIDGNPHSDYINANYINGHKVSRAYIATQGPKAATLNDFWRMIWQENIKHIAMLANIYESGKKKVEKYWPDINKTLHFGDITVQHVSQKVFADYEHRMFTVTHNEESRKVDQVHFSSWPDHGVPLYSQSLVPFLQKILQMPLSSKSPILVHCSAGVGRTGTILLCDICLRMAAREGHIDALKSVQLLRDQRANMVDNIEQYKLAHLVVLECLVGLHSSIPCNEIDESVRKLLAKDSLVLQMRYLKDTQWQDQAMKSVGQFGEEMLIVAEKNRFENIIPEIQGRVFISRYPTDDDTSSYINAVRVDGFRSPGRFMVTQQPMPNTLGDFWRLIYESNVSVIISLNEINHKDKTSCKFWPTNEQPQMAPVPYITLNHVDTRTSECYSIVTIHLNTDSRKEHLPITIISMSHWPSNTKCPRDIQEFLTFWKESYSMARCSNPIVITCYDGVKASGLYVAMTFIIEKMELEQVCDVCQAVRTIRHNREHFVQDIEQFKFLYEAAVLYINGFESYANFN